MKKKLLILLTILMCCSMMNTISAKSIEPFTDNGQIDNNNESYAIEYNGQNGRVYYGLNGIDIITDDNKYHLTTTFEVIKLLVLNDVNNDGYVDFLTYQNSSPYSAQVFTISGKDGAVLASLRLTYDSYNETVGATQKNSYIYKMVKFEDNVLIIYDYQLILVNPSTLEVLASYQDSDNIWDVEIVDGMVHIVDQNGQYIILDELLGEVQKQQLGQKYNVKMLYWDDMSIDCQMNLWDLYYDNQNMYILSEDGTLYINSLTTQEMTEVSISNIDFDEYLNIIGQDYKWGDDDKPVHITTNMYSDYFMNYKIVDDNGDYLLIRTFIMDEECLKSESYCDYEPCYCLYNKETGDIVYVTLQDNASKYQAILTTYKEQLAVLVVGIIGNGDIKVCYYGLAGEQLFQKEVSSSFAREDGKFKLSQLENNYLLEFYDSGCCIFNNLFTTVSYLYKSINTQLINATDVDYAIAYKENNNAYVIEKYDINSQLIWRHEFDGDSTYHGYEALKSADYNNDGVADYIAVTRKYNDKNEVQFAYYKIINGVDGSLLLNSALFMYTGYDENGRSYPVYCKSLDVSLLVDSDGDGRKELVIDNCIISSRDFKVKNDFYSYIESKGNLVEVGDRNGDSLPDYIDITDTNVSIFTSKLKGYEIEYIKANTNVTFAKDLENAYNSSLLDDINNDGVKEVLLNGRNSDGYQVFNVYNGYDMSFMYTICPKGVSDLEAYKTLNFDLNKDGYNEILAYSSSDYIYRIYDGKTFTSLKTINFDSEDDEPYTGNDTDYYHPEWIISNQPDFIYNSVICLKDLNNDDYDEFMIVKSYWNQDTFDSEAAIFIYDGKSYELLSKTPISITGVYDTSIRTIKNTNDLIIMQDSSNSTIYNLNGQAIASFNFNGSEYIYLNENTILASDSNKELYKLDIQPTFKLVSEIPDVIDDKQLVIKWISEVDYSTMKIVDNDKTVYIGDGSEYTLNLIEGHHTLVLSLSDSSGKTSSLTYKFEVSAQSNKQIWIVGVFALALAGALYVNMNRKMYVRKKGKEESK